MKLPFQATSNSLNPTIRCPYTGMKGRKPLIKVYNYDLLFPGHQIITFTFT